MIVQRHSGGTELQCERGQMADNPSTQRLEQLPEYGILNEPANRILPALKSTVRLSQGFSPSHMLSFNMRAQWPQQLLPAAFRRFNTFSDYQNATLKDLLANGETAHEIALMMPGRAVHDIKEQTGRLLQFGMIPDLVVRLPSPILTEDDSNEEEEVVVGVEELFSPRSGPPQDVTEHKLLQPSPTTTSVCDSQCGAATSENVKLEVSMSEMEPPNFVSGYQPSPTMVAATFSQTARPHGSQQAPQDPLRTTNPRPVQSAAVHTELTAQPPSSKHETAASNQTETQLSVETLLARAQGVIGMSFSRLLPENFTQGSNLISNTVSNAIVDHLGSDDHDPRQIITTPAISFLTTSINGNKTAGSTGFGTNVVPDTVGLAESPFGSVFGLRTFGTFQQKEPDSGITNHFQSITFVNQFQRYSFEVRSHNRNCCRGFGPNDLSKNFVLPTTSRLASMWTP